MEELKSTLSNIKRVDTPIFLDPDTTTWLDVARHGKTRQNLEYSTIEKHLRSARIMETHKVPVDFKNLNVENVVKHFDYRIEIEKATRGAIYMFLL